MSLNSLTTPFPWYRYSKKLAQKIDSPRCIGSFNKEESEERGMRLVQASEGSLEDGNFVTISWLVDKEDGGIVDAKFYAFGQSALIGAADAACELSIGKNYDQAQRITPELIDIQLRDKPDDPAFPPETIPHLTLVIDAFIAASQLCTDLPLAASYIAPPVPQQPIQGSAYPGWIDLPLTQKIAVIEDVLNNDVRPYIALDAGGVEVINLLNNQEVIITYQGACTSCYSSVGATLSYIQHILRTKVHPNLVVTPDLTFPE